MSGKAKLEEQLAALESLRQEPPETCVPAVRAMLKDRNNYLVAKVADLIAHRRFHELAPEVAIAWSASSMTRRSAIPSAGRRML